MADFDVPDSSELLTGGDRRGEGMRGNTRPPRGAIANMGFPDRGGRRSPGGVEGVLHLLPGKI